MKKISLSAEAKRSRNSSLATRVIFGLAAALVLVGLGLHISTWLRRGVIDFAMAANIGGLLVITLTGTFDPPHGRLRFALTVLALALLAPSAFYLLARI